jgi:hypothetical protein
MASGRHVSSCAVSCAVALMVATPLSVAADRTCQEYEALDRAGRLPALVADSGSEDSFEQRFRSHDIDHDGRPDEILLSCSGSASFYPGDPCELKVSLSTGRGLELARTRMILFADQGGVYARTAEPSPPIGDDISRAPEYYEIAYFKIEESQIRLICSFRKPG